MVAPEVRLEPLFERVAEDLFRLRADEIELKCLTVSLPDDAVERVHQFGIECRAFLHNFEPASVELVVEGAIPQIILPNAVNDPFLGETPDVLGVGVPIESVKLRERQSRRRKPRTGR